jgi:DNA segregation ATPase FtsK/SpoIIIE-like protein
MSENNDYDVPINEVAKILDKSDRQVRRYVKERRLKAKPVRIDGHIKLMFQRSDVEAFKAKFTPEGMLSSDIRDDTDDVAVTDTLTDSPVDSATSVAGNQEEAPAVKYVIDVLRDQINNLRDENRDLHYQLEQRSGQVGFLQAQVSTLQEEVKALAPIPKADAANPPRKAWWKLFSRN